MVDHVTPERRSFIMSKVGQKDTKPELALRRALHRLGYRYRLHRRDLPGTPDLVFPARRKVIFVHGCFWHGHGCRWGRLPKSRPEYWLPKIETNRERDRKAVTALREAGWEPLVVWQCELRDLEAAVGRVVDFLERPISLV
ncbi:very short patch repair endonuclease [Acidimangrovimonas sediminis]|uniref:very short patch repair endonuclease n=1 Tax=Acidimangrovimonas sediminis TaxID=2056283 RepID=UPI000C8017CD|nr:very short patch repair endonuclease [Acidimangrovimonas sediminis]